MKLSDRVTSRGASALARAQRLARPRVLQALAAQQRCRPAADAEHLGAAMHWLGLAQDAVDGNGVAARFDLGTGWDPAYPETTGYIVSTMLHHAAITGAPEFEKRAVRAGEWLMTVQAPEGWIAGGLARAGGGGRPEVFNTGQVVFGWLALHEVTKRDDFAMAAMRALRWLAAVQEDDGSWTQWSLHGAPHTYYSRVTWAVARAGVVLDDQQCIASARRSVEWICDQQRDAGWIDGMSFTPGSPALTHTIAYTIEGLIECSLLLDHERAREVALAATTALERTYRTSPGSRRSRHAGLAATFAPDWTSTDRYACVTGSAQAALCARRLHQFAGAPDLQAFAEDLTTSVKRAHPLTGPEGVRGGVPGSDPIWGSYASFKYLNWAAKFLADLMLDRVSGGLPQSRFG